MSMFDKLNDVENHYEELSGRLSDPAATADMGEYQKIAKQHNDLTEIVTRYREYKGTLKQLQETEEMLHGPLDDDTKELAQLELDELKSSRDELEEKLKI